MSVDRSLETKKWAIDSTSGSTKQNLSNIRCNPSARIVDGSVKIRIQDHLDYPWGLPIDSHQGQTPICGDSMCLLEPNLLDSIS